MLYEFGPAFSADHESAWPLSSCYIELYLLLLMYYAIVSLLNFV